MERCTLPARLSSPVCELERSRGVGIDQPMPSMSMAVCCTRRSASPPLSPGSLTTSLEVPSCSRSARSRRLAATLRASEIDMPRAGIAFQLYLACQATTAKQISRNHSMTALFPAGHHQLPATCPKFKMTCHCQRMGSLLIWLAILETQPCLYKELAQVCTSSVRSSSGQVGTSSRRMAEPAASVSSG